MRDEGRAGARWLTLGLDWRARERGTPDTPSPVPSSEPWAHWAQTDASPLSRWEAAARADALAALTSAPATEPGAGL